ncbi:alkylation response protein AidB-like acyl-CoA dehydrogenase [Kitasatospora sp. MAA4]|uniref:acyl-CoA dehydrogenase family protein n=1 Tax=Kitasatospora sp. MAA4 TaxID=3035093 RepID=UPI0024759A92|nr:acyl-CoA dehydrogenase family protein [Kitasatospora sp. MAA4]MDH6134253.1 alkylation response protein AidB-like acyl-CoA dehydrogenase [Kitasatospora sp. MAA4]
MHPRPTEAQAPALTFLSALESGRLDWELFRHFPEQPPADRKAGDAAVADVERFLRERLDPDEVDLTGRLPDGYLDDLRASGYLKLRNSARIGGLELSAFDCFRVIEQAASYCMPAGQMLAVQAGVGAPALIPALEPGPLLDFVNERIGGGAISGFGLTEPTGQNNTWPGMTATLSADGAHYVLRGSKVFTGHGPVADLLPVAATEHRRDGRRLCICFVDTSAPGFEVTSPIEFTGSRGLPNGALRFHEVWVPVEHVVRGELEDPRFPELMRTAVMAGQLYFTGAPAMAIAKLCRRWTGEFVARRRINGLPLGAYDEIQRMVAATLAEVYAMESVARWSLLDSRPGDRWFERLAAKNLLVRTAWRIVDRTVSLHGAEGIETVPSKLRRGVPAVPLERAMRDARGLRIAGNVDFQLDSQAAQGLLARCYQAAHAQPQPQPQVQPSVEPAGLSPANRAHLRAVADQVGEFRRTCLDLVRRFPQRSELFSQERRLILLGRIAAELFAATATLSRAGQAFDGDDQQALADVYCTAARHRLADHWRQLAHSNGSEPDHAAISRRSADQHTPVHQNRI